MTGTRKFISLGMALLLAAATPGMAVAKERGKGQGWGQGQPQAHGWEDSRGSKKYRGERKHYRGDRKHYRGERKHYRGERRYGGHNHRGHGHGPYKRVIVQKNVHHTHRHKYKHDHGYGILPAVALGLTAAYLVSRPAYDSPPAYQREVVYAPPPPVSPAPPVAASAVDYGPASTCVMTREYQTQIAVGGELVPGYGTACLQPDGAWYHGPAVPAQ